MSGLDLDAIEARANAATPGPWGVGNGTHIVRGLEVTGRGSFTCIQSVAEIDDEDDRLGWDRDEAVEVDPEDDAAFIAAARTDVPALVAEVRRLRAAQAGTRHRAGLIPEGLVCDSCRRNPCICPWTREPANPPEVDR